MIPTGTDIDLDLTRRVQLQLETFHCCGFRLRRFIFSDVVVKDSKAPFGYPWRGFIV